MLKRLGGLAAGLSIVALTVGSVAPATGHGDHHHGDRVRVLSTATEEDFVDVGAPDFSLGDSFVFTSDLTRHGTPVGHTGVVCTVTSVAREESQCLGSAVLDDGEITIQGLLAGEPDEFSFAITGGTGRYEGAEGTLVVKAISADDADVTVELLTFYLR